MDFDLLFHGGNCCGIKTIRGFPWPGEDDDLHEERDKTESTNLDSYGYDVSSDTSFFTDPEEDTEDRFHRHAYVEFCKKRRPQGAIEVTLARSEYVDQNKFWGPMLKKAGFKVTVPEFLNSNSGNWVTVYHLVYDATKKEPSNAPNPFGRSE